MKKFIIAIFAIGAVSFASCKKDYTCECTTKSGDSPAIITSSTVNGKKNDVKEACEKGNSTTEVMGIKVEVKCEIK